MDKRWLIVLLLVIFSLPTFAQKKDDTAKKLCKRWVIDRKAMMKQLGDKIEYERMVRDMNEFDVWIEFRTDGTAVSNEGNGEKSEKWELSPDEKQVMVGSNSFNITELSAKRLGFSVEQRPNIVFYFNAVKPSYKIRTRASKIGKRDDVPPVPPPPPPVKEKRERQ